MHIVGIGYMNNTFPATASKTDAQTGAVGLRAAKAVARDRGISDVTVWRWGKRGWITIVNVCGRPYVDLASLAAFDQRARNGEFAKPPSGAALKSAEARATKEAGK